MLTNDETAASSCPYFGKTYRKPPIVRFQWGPLRYVVVTPDFHHWHHSSDTEAIDRNYAAHYAFLDYLFGTAVKSGKRLPEKYGVVGDYMLDGWVAQQTFPFRAKPAEVLQK